MSLILLKNRTDNIFLIIVVVAYLILTIISLNNCYFWDNIQQISKEANWFYLNGLSSILGPSSLSSEIATTGYHPPLMGIMTAVLWNVFGYKLWVSHIFVLLWAIVLIYNAWKIIRFLFPVNYSGWVLLIVMLEPTILTQYFISSPDFILFTAFVISIRAVLERKPLLLTIGVFFICCINMRGIFVGGILLIVHCYYSYIQQNKKLDFQSFINIFLSYLPTILLLIAYFTYYLVERGWFFSGTSKSGHYAIPNGVGRIINHFAEFGLRSVENGRIFIWSLAIYVTYMTLKSKIRLTQSEQFLSSFFLLLTGLYVLFIFITQMPFSARYFMPQFLLLTVLTLLGLIKFINNRQLIICFVLIVCFELTGHFWIYPEKIAKSWDCTLAHLPYYELRSDCFKYIEHHQIDYNDISSGFCLYGNRRYIELLNTDKKISNNPNNKYFIYSNISNIDDSLSVDFKNKTLWSPIKKFEKWPVSITIYKNNMYHENKKL